MNDVSSINQLVISKFTEIIHANLEQENFGVYELAVTAGMSRSSVNRKLKTCLGKSTSQFIREVRLKRAMELLQSDLATAAEISFKVGFNSPTYFNFCFHQYYGFPPGEVKKRILLDPELTDDLKVSIPDQANDIPTVKASGLTDRTVFSRQNLIEGLTIIGAFLCLTLFWYFLFFRQATMLDVPRLKERDKSLVVLPFKNLSDNPENQYFAYGIMEDIMNQLFKIRELKVVSRTTGDNFRNGTLSASEISHRLGVNFILEGSVQQHDNKVRIIVQLIDGRYDRHVWSEKYDCEIADIFMVQSTIAKQIADELQTVLSTSEIERINKVPTKNMEAYNLYLKGRFNWIRMSEEGLEKCISFFEMALAADPNYALAYSGLADAYYIQTRWGWSSGFKGYLKARECALRALELDNKLGEAHATLGAVLCWNDWNWSEAQKEFNKALEFNPNSAKIHQYFSEYLDIIGNNIEARQQINLSLKLDPASPAAYFLSALYYYHEGKFDESLINFRKVEQLGGDTMAIYWNYFNIFYWKNDASKASEVLQKISSLKPPEEGNSFKVLEVSNYSKINELLKQLIDSELKKTEPAPLFLAKWYAMSGKKTESLKWLGKSLEMHLPGLPGINNDPDFELLRREPRFKEIIKKMGLSEYYNLKVPIKLKAK